MDKVYLLFDHLKKLWFLVQVCSGPDGGPEETNGQTLDRVSCSSIYRLQSLAEIGKIVGLESSSLTRGISERAQVVGEMAKVRQQSQVFFSTWRHEVVMVKAESWNAEGSLVP